MALPPDPDSTLPTVPTIPVPPSPRRKLASIRVLIPAIALVLIVAVLLGALQMVRGASATHRADAQPNATATSAMTSNDATATDSPTDGTPTPGPTLPPRATNTPTRQTGDVKITQNQDERQPCLNDPVPYTVVLDNAGSEAANFQVIIPPFTGAAQRGPIIGPQSSYPYWADVSPQNGSVAPGRSVSLVMTVRWPMPCGSMLYKGIVQLSFPSGATQNGIPITFGGTGPARYSKVVLVSGQFDNSEACPASGAPAPFTFAIQNQGNYFTAPAVYETQSIGLNWWAEESFVADPPGAVTSWLYPGQTWTITVQPRVGIVCDGRPYYVYISVNDVQGTQETMTFTYTFH